jgi:hypothetical protein
MSLPTINKRTARKIIGITSSLYRDQVLDKNTACANIVIFKDDFDFRLVKYTDFTSGYFENHCFVVQVIPPCMKLCRLGDFEKIFPKEIEYLQWIIVTGACLQKKYVSKRKLNPKVFKTKVDCHLLRYWNVLPKVQDMYVNHSDMMFDCFTFAGYLSQIFGKGNTLNHYHVKPSQFGIQTHLICKMVADWQTKSAICVERKYNISVGDVVYMLCSGRCHFSIYIGHGMFLSKFDIGNIAITSFEEMSACYHLLNGVVMIYEVKKGVRPQMNYIDLKGQPLVIQT